MDISFSNIMFTFRFPNLREGIPGLCKAADLDNIKLFIIYRNMVIQNLKATAETNLIDKDKLFIFCLTKPIKSMNSVT